MSQKTPVKLIGINQVVVNVRNMKESLNFWTEVVDIRQVGQLKPRADRPKPPNMRFYSGLQNESAQLK